MNGFGERIKSFMGRRGWKEVSLDRFPQLLIFTHPNLERRQLFVPYDESAPDFRDARKLLLDKLSEIEGRTAEQLLEELQGAADSQEAADSPLGPVDGMALRVVKAINGSESVPLSLASAAVRETESLLLASARAAERPRTYYRRLKNSNSAEVIGRAVFNHTKRGSFVMSVSCSIAGPGEQLTLDPDGSTFSRKAFVALFRGLSGVTQAIEADRILDFAEDQKNSERPVVSSNFCFSLYEIVKNDTGEGIEVSFQWSKYLPLPEDVDPDKTIVLSRSMEGPLALIAEQLAPRDVPVTGEFVGTVEALRGDINDAGKRAGYIELAILLPTGRPIRASANLNDEQYRIADQAHIAGKRYVLISGELMPNPRIWRFSTITSFTPLG